MLSQGQSSKFDGKRPIRCRPRGAPRKEAAPAVTTITTRSEKAKNQNAAKRDLDDIDSDLNLDKLPSKRAGHEENTPTYQGQFGENQTEEDQIVLDVTSIYKPVL